MDNLLNVTNKSTVLGAGGFGQIFTKQNHVVKLLYDVNACNELQNEVAIQTRAHPLLQNIIKVPEIYAHKIIQKTIMQQTYLCGIAMERIYGLQEYNGELIHLMLGEPTSKSRSKGRQTSKPITFNNPSRGFFANPLKVIDILDKYDSKYTLNSIAHIIGQTCKKLIDNNIVPIDLEFVYGVNDTISVIDFGLCRFGQVDSTQFLHSKGKEGLASEPYIPQEGQQGREAFLAGYFST